MAYRLDLTSDDGSEKKLGKQGHLRRAPAERTLAPNEELFHEGDQSREIYLVNSGEIAIIKGEGGEQIELARIGTGAVVGEMAMIDRQPRSATIKATQKTVVTIISEAVFVAALRNLPQWFIGVLKVITSRLRVANQSYASVSIPDPERCVAFFLYQQWQSEKLRSHSAKVALEYFACLDVFHFHTHMGRKKYNEHLGNLAKRGLIQLSLDQNRNRIINIHDGELLDIFCEIRNLQQADKPILAAAFSANHILCLNYLEKFAIELRPAVHNAPELDVAISKEELSAHMDENGPPQLTNLDLQAMRKADALVIGKNPGKINIDVRRIRRLRKMHENIGKLL